MSMLKRVARAARRRQASALFSGGRGWDLSLGMPYADEIDEDEGENEEEYGCRQQEDREKCEVGRPNYRHAAEVQDKRHQNA